LGFSIATCLSEHSGNHQKHRHAPVHESSFLAMILPVACLPGPTHIVDDLALD
jgi:hypothetical protein